jgi:methionyl-tRNA synthetase
MDSIQQRDPILITTPIFYVNGSPHVGHLFSVLLGDALARWHRLLGHPTLFTVGTDEHGIKVQEAAKKHGKDVKTFCDEVTTSFSNLWSEANISYDDYIRTTEDRHKEAVNHIWKLLAEKEQIYLGEFEGWYSVSDETFYTPLQVEDELDSVGKPTGNKIATETGNVVTWLQEPNYKFKLSEFSSKLLDWIVATNPVHPPVRAQELIKELTQNGLRDLSISRLKEKIQWGIPVPGDENHVIYVWLDALTNYLTVCGYPRWHKDQSLQKFWPATYHILGKDIVKFHALYWPAFLIAADLPLPKHIITHAHWTKDRKKISKSKGNTVEPSEIIAQFGLDPVRFVLLRQGGIANDGDYNEEEVQNIISDELANSLGNLISRVTSRGVNPSGAWPIFSESSIHDEDAKSIVSRLRTIPQEVDVLYKQCEFGKAIQLLFALLSDVNLYLTKNAPWKLLPKPAKKAKEGSVPAPAPALTIEDPATYIRYQNILYLSLEAVRLSLSLLQPITPGLSERSLDFLGIPTTARNPLQYGFGIDYRQISTLETISPELFVLIDERAKKQARFESKQLKRDPEASSL